MKARLALVLLSANLVSCQNPQVIGPASRPSATPSAQPTVSPSPQPTAQASVAPSSPPSTSASSSLNTTQFTVALKPELLAEANGLGSEKVDVTLYRRPADGSTQACSNCFDFSWGAEVHEGQGIPAAQTWRLDKAASLSLSTDKLQPGDTFALVVAAHASSPCQQLVSAATVRVASAGPLKIDDFLQDGRWKLGTHGVTDDLGCVPVGRARFKVTTENGLSLPANTRLHVTGYNLDADVATTGSTELTVPGIDAIKIQITADGYEPYTEFVHVRFPRHPYSGMDDPKLMPNTSANPPEIPFSIRPQKR